MPALALVEFKRVEIDLRTRPGRVARTERVSTDNEDRAPYRLQPRGRGFKTFGKR